MNALRCEHGGIAVRGEVAELQDGSIIFLKSGTGSLANGTLTEVTKGQVHERVIGFGRERLRFPEPFAEGQSDGVEDAEEC